MHIRRVRPRGQRQRVRFGDACARDSIPRARDSPLACPRVALANCTLPRTPGRRAPARAWGALGPRAYVPLLSREDHVTRAVKGNARLGGCKRSRDPTRLGRLRAHRTATRIVRAVRVRAILLVRRCARASYVVRAIPTRLREQKIFFYFFSKPLDADPQVEESSSRKAVGTAGLSPFDWIGSWVSRPVERNGSC